MSTFAFISRTTVHWGVRQPEFLLLVHLCNTKMLLRVFLPQLLQQFTSRHSQLTIVHCTFTQQLIEAWFQHCSLSVNTVLVYNCIPQRFSCHGKCNKHRQPSPYSCWDWLALLAADCCCCARYCVARALTVATRLGVACYIYLYIFFSFEWRHLSLAKYLVRYMHLYVKK